MNTNLTLSAQQPVGQATGPEDPEAAQPAEPPDVAKPLWVHPSGVLFALSPLDHFQVQPEGSAARPWCHGFMLWVVCSVYKAYRLPFLRSQPAQQAQVHGVNSPELL